MPEDNENKCEFKAVCHMSHNVSDKTCGYHLVNKTEDCPLYKFAERIQTNFAEKVKEAIRKDTTRPGRDFAYLREMVDPKHIIDIINDTLKQGDD